MSGEPTSLAARVAAAWHPPSALSTAAFLAIVAAAGALIVVGVRRSAPEGKRDAHAFAAALGVALVLGATALAAASGLLVREDLPLVPAMGLVLGSNLLALGLALSPVGGRMARAIPPALLIAPQALRLPLELVLHRWYLSDTIPVQMTYEGHNFDVLTGVAALGVGVWAGVRPPPRGALLAVNALGLGLLLVVMTIAVRSVPGPLHVYGGPLLVLPFHVPYVWIVPMCVSAALFGHVVAFRALAHRPPQPDGYASA